MPPAAYGRTALGVAAIGAITLTFSHQARTNALQKSKGIVTRVRRMLGTRPHVSKTPVSTSSAVFEVGPAPPARRDEGVADVYFGTRVADPYRWCDLPYAS